MSERRWQQWFAWPDPVRAPWKRRLVCGVPFALVIAGVVAWRASRPTLGKDVKMEAVTREEAEAIVGEVARTRSKFAFIALKHGRVKECVKLLRPEKVSSVLVIANTLATVRTLYSDSGGNEYWFERRTNGWVLKFIGINSELPHQH